MSKRIQDLKSPMTKWREKVVAVAAKPFRSLSTDQRFWFGFTLLCVLATLLINNPLWRASGEQHAYKEGDIIRESIISPSDVYFSDTDETERLKTEARNAAKPIFRYESNKAEHALQTFLSSWEKLQRRSGELSNAK